MLSLLLRHSRQNLAPDFKTDTSQSRSFPTAVGAHLQLAGKNNFESCLEHITPLSFGERIPISEGMTLIPIPSGNDIGSCNWLIITNAYKISILGSSSPIGRGTRPTRDMDISAFNQTNIMLVLNRVPISLSFEDQVSKFKQVLASSHPFAIITCDNSAGIISDILERIINFIQSQPAPSSMSVHFVCEFGLQLMRHLTVLCEYLSEVHIARAMLGKSPFLFDDAISKGVLFVHTGITKTLEKALCGSEKTIVLRPYRLNGER